MNFGRHHTYALDADLELDESSIKTFLDTYGGEPFLIFGFTYMVWLHLFEPAMRAGLDLSNGVLVHSGGWKKLVDQAVDPVEFRERLGNGVGLRQIHNFYGMVEQIGTVYLEGPDDPGVLYAPAFADVIIRDPVTWKPVQPGGTGVIEVVSLLPRSYPGHALLTEDLGELVGVDDGPVWKGNRFRVLGPRSACGGSRMLGHLRAGRMSGPISMVVPAGPDIDLVDLLDAVNAAEPLEFFDPEAVEFLAAFSRALLHDVEARRHPELVSLAFFFRRSALGWAGGSANTPCRGRAVVTRSAR